MNWFLQRLAVRTSMLLFFVRFVSNPSSNKSGVCCGSRSRWVRRGRPIATRQVCEVSPWAIGRCLSRTSLGFLKSSLSRFPVHPGVMWLCSKLDVIVSSGLCILLSLLYITPQRSSKTLGSIWKDQNSWTWTQPDVLLLLQGQRHSEVWNLTSS